MKSEEKIREKLESMELDLQKYKSDYDALEKYIDNNKIKKIEEDMIYISITNQIAALKWVLKDR